MRLKTILRWPFTRKASITTSEKPKTSSPQASQSWSLYLAITELPLSRFIRLSVDGDYQALVISGEPPLNELQKAAELISQQYTDTIGDIDYKLYCQTLKEITLLQLTLEQVNNLVNTLREAYNPVLARALNSLLSTNFTFDITNLAGYDRMLDGCISRSKSLKIQLDIQLKRYEQLQTKFEGDGKKPTREYYKGILMTLSDAAGYNLPEDSMTVWEFAERMRRFHEKMKKPKEHV